MLTIPKIRKKLILAMGDGLVVAALLVFLYQWNPFGLARTLHAEEMTEVVMVSMGLLKGIGYTFVFYILQLYFLSYNPFRLFQLGIATLGCAIISFLLFTLLPDYGIRPVINLVHGPMAAVALIIWRLLAYGVFLSPEGRERVVIIGAGEAGQSLLAGLEADREHYTAVGFLDDNLELKGKKMGAVEVCGTTDLLDQWVREDRIDAAVVAITHEMHDDLIHRLFDIRLKGFPVYDAATLYEKVTCKIHVLHVKAGWFLQKDFYGFNQDSFYMRVGKRIFDLFFSTLILLLTAPVIFITAVAIKLESPGPIFYRQKRVGRNKELFYILKLRSMRMDAEKAGAQWAKKNDPRVTRVGAFIRKVRIDEIPQIWNVFRGEMSFIGPRPERPEFEVELEREIPFYAVKHVVKPGITGWAQVSYPYGASKEDALQKIQYDIFYIKNLSLVWDLYIILKTVKTVLLSQGGR